MNNNTKEKVKKIISIACFIFFIVSLVVYFFVKCSTSCSSAEQRCWYCHRVIFSNGRALHATLEFGNLYTCDYCGMANSKD